MLVLTGHYRLLIPFLAALTSWWILSPRGTAAAEVRAELVQPLDCVINPSEVADLGSSVAGVISTVEVDRGDPVQAGQIVAQLDSRVEQAAVELARARAGLRGEVDLRRENTAFSQRQYARAKDLYSKKVLSTNDMDERETEVKVAKIQLGQARDNKLLAGLELQRAEQVLDRRSIRSPFKGVVMERYKTAGEYIEDQPVVRVAQLDPLYVEVLVPVELLGKVRGGAQAEVWVDAMDAGTWTAQVDRIDPVADAASGTYGVRLTLPNPDYTLPAGLGCQLRFLEEQEVAVVAQRAAKAADAAKEVAGNGASHTLQAQPLDSEPATGNGTNREPPLEQDPAPLAEKEVASAPAVGGTPEGVSNDCKFAGPYAESDTAKQHAQSLRDQGLEIGVQQKQELVQVGLWILSEPLTSKEEARTLVQDLRAAGVKDFFLTAPNGGKRYASLGFFKNRRLAEDRVADLARKGFATRLSPWRKHRSTYWLTARPSEAEQAAEIFANLPGGAGGSPTAEVNCPQIAGG